MPTAEDLCDYEALTRGAGLVDLGQRTLIELSGADRASFLHNFCTHDIRKLAPGENCEAFITNVQGKVLAHVQVFARADSLLVETVGGWNEKLLAHLDRYLIREQVQLVDRSQEWGELLLAGADVKAALESVKARCLDVRHVEIIRPQCHALIVPREQLAGMATSLQAAGVRPCGTAALEMARLEAGFPWYGRDITEENLAPEVGRDKQAISYIKGCYLGQETIARIDALGHVNRLLVGVAFDASEIPPAATQLLAGDESSDKVVGQVTSAAYSPRLGQPLALAYVRRGHNEPGSLLQSSAGTATVVQLPL